MLNVPPRVSGSFLSCVFLTLFLVLWEQSEKGWPDLVIVKAQEVTSTYFSTLTESKYIFVPLIVPSSPILIKSSITFY